MIKEFSLSTFACLLSGLALVLLYVLYGLYFSWKEHFARKRVHRSDKDSPSHKQHPDVVSWQTNKDSIIAAAHLHPCTFSSCELIHSLEDAKVARDAIHPRRKTKSAVAVNNVLQSRAKCMSLVKPSVCSDLEKSKSLSTSEKADKLNMDHIFIPFTSFLWAHLFVGINLMYLWVKGLIILIIRKKLVHFGWIKPKPFEPKEVVGRLCLESTLPIHYYAKTRDGNIAGFFFSNFPIVNSKGEYEVKDLLAVDIDLKTKTMVKAKLDDDDLTASETITLLWFITFSSNHVKLHALANWGVNCAPEQTKNDPFHARNSLVTVIYNYFGYHMFSSTLMPIFMFFRVLDHRFAPASMVKVFDHGINSNIWSHPNIRDLARISEFVGFAVKVRSIFMKEFDIHKKCFPGVHAEALFVGTILHSLDHTLADWNLEDPLWLDTSHPKFGLMAQMGQIVKVGFVKDLPGLFFHKQYKGSGHPFYEAVYEQASKINRVFADNMDTCIIK